MLKPGDIGPVLITGCSAGVGRAAALAFRAAGFETFASARDTRQLDALRDAGCRVLELDVTDEAQRTAAITAIEQQFGALGILVNNAGYGQYGPLEEISLDAMRRQFETNVFGGFRLAQLALPGMRRRGRGRIINVSSVAGRVSIPGGGAYHASKFAIEAMADAMRPEVKPFGIDVVNILPGPIATQFGATLLKFMPDTGAQSPYRDFKVNLVRSMSEFLRPGRFGVLSAERVAGVIVKAATAAHPCSRYTVGLYAFFGPIGRAITPDRLVDVAMQADLSPQKK